MQSNIASTQTHQQILDYTNNKLKEIKPFPIGRCVEELISISKDLELCETSINLQTPTINKLRGLYRDYPKIFSIVFPQFEKILKKLFTKENELNENLPMLLFDMVANKNQYFNPNDFFNDILEELIIIINDQNYANNFKKTHSQVEFLFNEIGNNPSTLSYLFHGLKNTKLFIINSTINMIFYYINKFSVNDLKDSFDWKEFLDIIGKFLVDYTTHEEGKPKPIESICLRLLERFANAVNILDTILLKAPDNFLKAFKLYTNYNVDELMQSHNYI